jgi:acyl-CoA synthetase (AMP-forming)/AMP-acid ligase II
MIDANGMTNLGSLVREAASRFGNQTILRFEGSSLSFTQLEERSNQLSNVLEKLGVKAGDRVAVMLGNGFDFPMTWLSIAKLGAIMIPVNTQYQHDDLRFVLRDSGAWLLVTSPEFVALANRVQPECETLENIVVFGTSSAAIELRHAMKVASKEFALPTVARDALVNLQYTSGTTGFPKGCMLSHAYWLELGLRTSEMLECHAGDVNLTVQPFYYMDPQWNLVLCLLNGIPLVVAPKFSVSKFWPTIHSEGVTFFYCLGTIPVFLLKQPENPALEQGHKLRFVSCSGIVPQFHALFESRFAVPWREGFGMTETGVDIAMPISSKGSDSSSVGSNKIGSGSIGKPVRGKEARIIRTEESGLETVLPDGETGELIVRGGVMMQGYWNRPEATAQALKGGWMHTGDLAYRDANGNYFLVGRLKDMIRRGSENIAAVEVEAVICEHKQVLMAAVVAEKDEARGEEVKAFVQLNPGATLEPSALLEFLRPKLAKFKLPRYVAFVDSFPLTPSEKIAKHQLNTPEYAVRTFDALEGTWRNT